MPDELTEVEKTGEEKPNRMETMLSGIENMLHRILLSTAVKERTDTEIPYYGPDSSLYAGTFGGWPAFPIANYHGEITLPSLQRAFSEINDNTLITQPEKVQALRKILATYHAVMFEDDSFETTVQTALDSAKEPEPVLQESAEGLSEGSVIYEFAYTGDANTDTIIDQENEAGSLIYRNILRTGKWAVSPNGSKEPLVIDKTILDNLHSGFNDGAFEYVTVPETHQDLPSENRGFIRKLEVVEDPQRQGEYVLRGGFEFTNADARKAALEGSIAGVSCGIVFKHPRKSDGKLFDVALHHVALTNKPWIDGLGGWDKIAASEFGAEVVVGVEDNNVVSQENIEMADQEKNEMQLSQEEINVLLAENARLKLAQERSKVADFLRPYQTEKNLTPAVLAQAEKLMFAASVTPKMMTLSDTDTQVEFDLAETVKALLDSIPAGVDLSENVADKDQTPTPENVKTLTPEEHTAQIRELTGFKPITED